MYHCIVQFVLLMIPIQIPMEEQWQKFWNILPTEVQRRSKKGAVHSLTKLAPGLLKINKVK